MPGDNSFYKKIIDTLMCSVCVFDTEREIVYCNREFMDSYMGGTDSYEGKSLYDVDQAYIDRITAVPRVLDIKSTVTVEKRDSAGAEYYIVTTPMFGKDGSLEHVIEAIYSDADSESLSGLLENEERASDDMVFMSPRLIDIKMTIDRISTFDSTVLITGETGTGKSTLARYIHENSKRCRNEFAVIDCASVSEEQMASMLFGSAPGTPQDPSGSGKAGLVEVANGGTLFIDEIGMMPLSIQGRILKLIQDGGYLPVGAAKERKVKVRIISATSMNLENRITNGQFREDLYYRLRVIEFHLPPIRERKEDFDVMLDHFVMRYNGQYQMNKSFSDKAKAALRNYSWPGNVSELENMVERALVTSKEDEIKVKDLPDSVVAPTGPGEGRLPSDLENAVDTYERQIIEEAVRQYGSSYKVAEALNITQSKASRLIRKYGVGKAENTQKNKKVFSNR